MQWPRQQAAATVNPSPPAVDVRQAPDRAPAPSALPARQGLSDRALAWLFVGPTIALLLAFNIFPLLWTIWLSFTNFRANRPNAEVVWLGIDNYRRVLNDEAIWENMRATAHFLVLLDRAAAGARLRRWRCCSTGAFARTVSGAPPSCCP